MGESGSSNSKVCRVVIQQCRSASLSFDVESPSVSIGSGMVVFTCFLQGAEEGQLDGIVKQILNAKLCEDPGQENSSRDSVLQRKQDILIIPQATLGGKLKGKGVQYHGLVEKFLGEELFHKFVSKVKDSVEAGGGTVSAGVYGARQILKMDTNGPFTHVFEF